MSAALTTPILAALRRRYPAETGEYVTAVEVGEALGASRRRADFLAMSCWPSRGLGIEGVEIKVYRADWLRELKNPAKAEEGCYHYCDRWWIAARLGVVQADELPEGWGLLHYNADRDHLNVAVRAAKKEARPITRAFMASFMRAQGKPSEEEVAARINSEVNKRIRVTEQRAEERVTQWRDAGEALRHRAEALALAGGPHLKYADEAQIRDAGAWLKVGKELGITGQRAFLATVAEQVNGVQEAIEAAQQRVAALCAAAQGQETDAPV